MEVVEEVLTRTATGGNTRKKAPYTAKDFLLTSSAGATHTNRRKKGKKKPTKKQPPFTASVGTAANFPQPFGKAPHCSGHHKEAQQCSGESLRHRGLPGGHYQKCPTPCQGPCCCCGPPGRPCHCGHSSLPDVSPWRDLQ
ncbi:hypothetical protein MRX96_018127 [Rhipicephalus microplus]